MHTLQQRIKQFTKANTMDAPLPYRLLDLVAELGEVAKEVLEATHYGTKPPVYTSSLKEELGDLFFTLIATANACEVDLEEALEKVLDKYERRLQQTGSAGSKGDTKG